MRSADEVLAAVAAVTPLIRGRAAAAEQAGRAPDELIAALHQQRLFRLWIPERFGGDELPLPDALRAFEAVARVDGSIGWLVTIGVGGGLFAAYMEASAARAIYEPADALIAGSGAPSGRAQVVRGGYRVSGQWRYASGAPHATWFTANAVVYRRSESAPPPRTREVRAMAFPADTVTVESTWDVAGLRATASHDFAVAAAFVPGAYSFAVGDARQGSGPLYRFPFGSIAELSFASVGLGIARHAMDEFAALAATRRLAESGALLRTRPAAHDAYARAEANVSAARAWLFAVALTAWRTVAAGRRISVTGRR
jgi:alkylation response protein AidB-like acyl-CoA dehydrogenase